MAIAFGINDPGRDTASISFARNEKIFCCRVPTVAKSLMFEDLIAGDGDRDRYELIDRELLELLPKYIEILHLWH